MKGNFVVINGGCEGVGAAPAKRIPSSVNDPVFITDTYTRERILLAKQKSTQEIWMLQEGEDSWIPWRALSANEILHYYDCAPRLHLVAAEHKVLRASA